MGKCPICLSTRQHRTETAKYCIRICLDCGYSWQTEGGFAYEL